MFEGIVARILSATFLKPFIDGFLTYKKQELDATGSHEAQVEALSVKALELDRREAELNAAVNMAELDKGSWFARLPRPLMGNAVAVLVVKLLVWDLALGQWTHGHTDKLSDQTLWVITTIIIAYFGGRTVEGVANTVANIFKKTK